MISSSYRQECLCGRSFDNAGAFTRHKKTCLSGKKRLASALTHARECYHRKKRRVVGDEESPSSSQTTSLRAVPHTADEALNGIGPSDFLGLVDAREPTLTNETARRSGPREVCMPFSLFYLT